MNTISNEVKQLLLEGVVIPAHPLALTKSRKLDARRQKLLTRYYLASGAGGVAVGVHTTQFAIRHPKHYLYEQVLRLTMDAIVEANSNRPIIKIAGVSGLTQQAVKEAKLAKSLGYDLVLLNTNGLAALSENQLIERARAIGEVMPLFGFYLQPSVGGRLLSQEFWGALSAIDNLFAIKIAPFNRYQTLDVVQAVCRSTRCEDIALYTGNDDNIVLDLLSTYQIPTERGMVKKEIVGGLLGHWAVWTQQAVTLLEQIKTIKKNKQPIRHSLLTTALKITDTNAAFFDATNDYKGCIAGIHEVLRRQGLLEGIWCLDPEETLSPGQSEQIDRVYRDYPELNDDEFVRGFLHTHYPNSGPQIK